MSPAKTQEVEWRFGGRAEDVEAWLRHPAELHINVLFRPPHSTQWHSIMTVTWAWLRKHAENSHLGWHLAGTLHCSGRLPGRDRKEHCPTAGQRWLAGSDSQRRGTAW